MKEALLVLVCLAGGLRGQTQVDLRTQTKDVDFSGAVSTTPWKVGTVLPATCSVGQVFFNTTAPAGQNVYLCTVVNSWTAMAGSGVRFTSGAGAPAGNCTAGQDLYTDTTNLDTWFCESANTWKKALSTTNTGSFAMTGQNGAVPGAPPSGSTALFFNSTAKVGQSVDDAGGVATMVRPTDCSAGNQVVQSIDSNGNPLCATAGGAETKTLIPLICSASGGSEPMWWIPFNSVIVSSCPATTGQYLGFLHWNDDGTHGIFVIIPQVIPAGWSGGAVSFTFFVRGSATYTWGVRTACLPGGGAMDPTNPTFQAEQDVVIATSGGVNQYTGTLTSLTTTGCAAGNLMLLKLLRNDSAGFSDLYAASITFNKP